VNSGLGHSQTTIYKINYAEFLTALKADSKTADDASAVASLGNTRNNPVTNDANITVNTANLKALRFRSCPIPSHPQRRV
jgi:hypothetical protein